MFVGYQMSVTAIGSLFIVLNKHHFDKGFFSIFSEQNYRSEMLLKYNYCYNYKLFVYHSKQEENRPKYNFMSKHLIDKPPVVKHPQMANPPVVKPQCNISNRNQLSDMSINLPMSESSTKYLCSLELKHSYIFTRELFQVSLLSWAQALLYLHLYIVSMCLNFRLLFQPRPLSINYIMLYKRNIYLEVLEDMT